MTILILNIITQKKFDSSFVTEIFLSISVKLFDHMKEYTVIVKYSTFAVEFLL